MAKSKEKQEELTENLENLENIEEIPDELVSQYESDVVQEDNKEVTKRVKVKLIKDLPRVYIIDNFYSGERGQTLVVSESVAYILRGSDNTTEVFAV